MPICTLQNVFDAARGHLSDTQIAGGESFTNTYLQPHFAEPYRTVFSRLVGGSKRVQRIIYLVLPVKTSVLIPSTFGVTDLSEPEMVEERDAPAGVPISTTDTSTPIIVTTVNPHNLGVNGSIVQGTVSGVAGSIAPWGNWFATVTGASTFTLNGSGPDGNSGTGGNFYPENNQEWGEVQPADLMTAGMDGQPQSQLGVYIWYNELFQFRGATTARHIRITYYASGNPPTNANTNINIDNVLDVLAVGTAANAARSKGWWGMYERLRNQAYGDPSRPDDESLLDVFYRGQVLAAQRGPARRQQPMRAKRSKFGEFLLG